MGWHTDSRTCSHANEDVCAFCGGVDLHYTGQCHHYWLDRPESDSRECLICGEEVFGPIRCPVDNCSDVIRGQSCPNQIRRLTVLCSSCLPGRPCFACAPVDHSPDTGGGS